MQRPITLVAFPAFPSQLGRSGPSSITNAPLGASEPSSLLVGKIDLTTNLHSFIHWTAFVFTLLSIMWDIFSALFLIRTTAALASVAVDREDGNGVRK